MRANAAIEAKSGKRGRGRPRKFDQAQIQQSVLGVFWRMGYSGATLPDLSEAAGVTRPSLYAAMGDKLSMYLKSLEHFHDGLEARLNLSLGPSRPLAEGLLDFYLALIEKYWSGGKDPLGCLIFCTAPADAVEEPAVRSSLLKTQQFLEERFAEAFRVAQQNGEIQADANPVQAASFATAIVHSLALRSRAGEGKAALKSFAVASVDMLVGNR